MKTDVGPCPPEILYVDAPVMVDNTAGRIVSD